MTTINMNPCNQLLVFHMELCILLKLVGLMNHIYFNFIWPDHDSMERTQHNDFVKETFNTGLHSVIHTFTKSVLFRFGMMN